jgi:serine/alanine adding enzyme
MEIKKVTNVEEYNSLIRCSVSGHFMQSTYWSDLKAKFGWGTLGQYLIMDGERAVGAFSILKKSKFGITILYMPRGPIWFEERGEIITFGLDSLKQIAKKEHAFFLRI